MTGWTLQEAVALGRGTERSFNCHLHDDRNASASVNVDKGVWCCYGCGGKGVLDGVPVPDTDYLMRMMLEVTPRVFAEPWLEMYDAAYPSPYWADRFGKQVASRYRCGTHPMNGTPTYPIRNVAGWLLGVVERTGGTPKYRYPSGVPVSRCLFAHRLLPSPVLVLVEGAADVMALDADGLDRSSGVLVVGCYGAGVHAPQVEAIRQLAPRLIVAAFDDDDAGRSAARRAHASLADMTHFVSYQWGMIEGTSGRRPKDPGEAQAPGRSLGEFIARQEGMSGWGNRNLTRIETLSRENSQESP